MPSSTVLRPKDFFKPRTEIFGVSAITSFPLIFYRFPRESGDPGQATGGNPGPRFAGKANKKNDVAAGHQNNTLVSR